MGKQPTTKRMRYSDRELSLVKNTFAEQEETLVLVRKFMLQGELTESEQGYLNTIASNMEVVRILRKALVPSIDKQAPPFQTVDLLSSLDVQQTPNEHANLVIKARQMAIEYLKQRFDELVGTKVNKHETIEFDKLTDFEEDGQLAHIKLMCRNFLLSHVDTQLFNSILVMAGDKDESPERQKQRLSQDSNK